MPPVSFVRRLHEIHMTIYAVVSFTHSLYAQGISTVSVHQIHFLFFYLAIHNVLGTTAFLQPRFPVRTQLLFSGVKSHVIIRNIRSKQKGRGKLKAFIQ